jgi:predicted DNA-binding transcriptional regulator AlpA
MALKPKKNHYRIETPKCLMSFDPSSPRGRSEHRTHLRHKGPIVTRVAMPFVTFRYLQSENIMPNRMTLARSIEQLGFPQPLALGKNRIAWRLEEVEAWLASRPRRTPKTGANKAAPNTEAADPP